MNFVDKLKIKFNDSFVFRKMYFKETDDKIKPLKYGYKINKLTLIFFQIIFFKKIYII